MFVKGQLIISIGHSRKYIGTNQLLKNVIKSSFYPFLQPDFALSTKEKPSQTVKFQNKRKMNFKDV